MTLATLDDVLRAVDEAPAAPGLGWALAHCAQSIDCSVHGYPRLRSGLFRATVGRLVKRRFLGRGAMTHDTSAPIAGAAELPRDLPADDGRARLRAAIDAFRAHAGALAPHLAYGACTREQYERLHAMHVADHLGALAR